MSRKLRYSRGAAVLGALTLLAAACSGDADGDATDPADGGGDGGGVGCL